MNRLALSLLCLWRASDGLNPGRIRQDDGDYYSVCDHYMKDTDVNYNSRNVDERDKCGTLRRMG